MPDSTIPLFLPGLLKTPLVDHQGCITRPWLWFFQNVTKTAVNTTDANLQSLYGETSRDTQGEALSAAQVLGDGGNQRWSADLAGLRGEFAAMDVPNYGWVRELQDLQAYVASIHDNRQRPVAPLIFDVHANRNSYVPVAQQGYVETDRMLLYYGGNGADGQSAWVYTMGTFFGAQSDRPLPPDIGLNDTGLTFHDMDGGKLYRWTGSVWQTTASL
ncbi:MAG TPA: hypothetical protein VHI13_08875 [Candidatus Kapabacteria bacterium]|nr:hypothetical protein [Candidatus Kapabacteria bacterium]